MSFLYLPSFGAMIEIAETLDRSASRWEGARCTPEEAGCTSQMSVVAWQLVSMRAGFKAGGSCWPLGPLGPLGPLHAWASRGAPTHSLMATRPATETPQTIVLLFFVSCIFIIYFLQHFFLFSYHPLLPSPAYYDAFLSAFNDIFSDQFFPPLFFVFRPFFLPRFLYSLSFVFLRIMFTYT